MKIKVPASLRHFTHVHSELGCKWCYQPEPKVAVDKEINRYQIRDAVFDQMHEKFFGEDYEEPELSIVKPEYWVKTALIGREPYCSCDCKHCEIERQYQHYTEPVL